MTSAEAEPVATGGQEPPTADASGGSSQVNKQLFGWFKLKNFAS